MAVSKRAQWQRYIDDALLKTEQVTMAAIHSIDGTRWATSKDFEVRLIIILSSFYSNHFFVGKSRADIENSC